MKITFVLASVMCLASVASAAPPAAPDEATKKAANELVKTMMTKEIYNDMVVQMSEQMFQAMQGQGAKLPPDAASRVRKVVLECVPYDEMSSWSAEVYAANFNAKELKDLTTFYKTTTGQKLAKSMPQIMAATGQRTGATVMQRMPAALKKHGLVPEGAGPPGSGPPANPPPSKK